jgi:hypothetical protein
MAHFRDTCCHLGHTESSGTSQGGVDIFVEPVSGQDYYLRPAPADIGRSVVLSRRAAACECSISTTSGSAPGSVLLAPAVLCLAHHVDRLVGLEDCPQVI